MTDEPTRYLHPQHNGGRRQHKKFVSRSPDRSNRIVPTGTAAEVGRELRNMIRVIDTRIIGATKMWDDMLKMYLVEARLTIGQTPRKEAEALNNLIAVVCLHIFSPTRWQHNLFSRELIPAIQSAREVLGQGVDERLEDIVGTLP